MSQPRRRADAQRNHERLLKAAAAVIAEQGPQASLDEVANRAGVGAGTLYRHFPTREDLLLAVFTERIEGLCADAEALWEREAPGAALTLWLRGMLDHAMSDNGLVETLALAGSKPDVDCSAMILDAASGLLDRARHVGEVRLDVAADDLLRLVVGIGLSADNPDQAHHLLTLTLEGLSPSEGR